MKFSSLCHTLPPRNQGTSLVVESRRGGRANIPSGWRKPSAFGLGVVQKLTPYVAS